MPGKAQLRHILIVDLFQRAEALLVVSSAVAHPVPRVSVCTPDSCAVHRRHEYSLAFLRFLCGLLGLEPATGSKNNRRAESERGYHSDESPRFTAWKKHVRFPF